MKNNGAAEYDEITVEKIIKVQLPIEYSGNVEFEKDMERQKRFLWIGEQDVL